MRVARLALLMVVAALAACADHQAPARRALADIDVVLDAVAGEAAGMVPEQYSQVRRQVDDLQTTLGRGQYGAVVAAAPAVLAAVHALQVAVADHKAAARAQQDAEWARLADSLPDEFAAIERRLGSLREPAQRKAAAGIDLDAGQRAVREAVALWSKGQAAYAAGNLAEALQAAHDVQARADAISASLRR